MTHGMYEYLSCPDICPDPLLKLKSVTMADVADYKKLGDCVKTMPTESCIRPLAPNTWEQGRCHGQEIAKAEPTINLWDGPHHCSGDKPEAVCATQPIHIVE